MLIISIKDNENNKWKKKNAKKKKIRGMEAIVKEWEINDFVVRLSYALCN